MDGVEGTRTFKGGADAYDTYMGRYSRELAPVFADAAGITVGDRVLDVGCGSGALTDELVRRVGPERVAGCDPTPGFLAACRERHPGADLREGRAEALPFDDQTFDIAYAQLVLHFVSDAPRAARELRRVVRPGGRVAVCVWDFEGGMEMLRMFWDAAVSLDEAAPDELHALRFGRSGELRALLTDAGLQQTTEQKLTVSSGYADFDELWSTLLLGIGPAGSYAVAQSAERQAALKAAYRKRIGSPTGPFTLQAVARAAVGTVSE